MNNKNSKTIKLKPQVLNRDSLILAYSTISESELFYIYPDYTYDLEFTNPVLFKSLLFTLGIDINLKYTKQENLIHRNKLNKVVQCNRYVGEERQDKEWLESGKASKEVLDKATKNKILEDIYRSRGFTKDTEAVQESKDHYTIIDETQWITNE